MFATGAIMATLLVSLTKMMSLGISSEHHLALGNDLNSIKRLITQSLDCAQTIAVGNQLGTTTSSAVDVTSGPDCEPDSSEYKLLTLRDRLGNPLTSPLITAPGNFQNTAQSGAWHIRTKCDRAQGTLVVQVARASGTEFAKDPLTRRKYDFSHNPRFLFGGGNEVKLCAESFSGGPRTVASPTASTCPAGQYMVGIKADGSLECRPFTEASKHNFRSVDQVGPNSAHDLAIAECASDETVLSGYCQCHGFATWAVGVATGPNGRLGWACACNGNANHVFARAMCVK